MHKTKPIVDRNLVDIFYSTFIMGNQIVTSSRSQFNKIISSGGILIDVRSPKKFKESSLHDSFNFPLNTLEHNWKILKSFNRPIILICENGELSNKAKTILHNHHIDVHIGGPWENFL